jgi:hypothetical protein
MDEARALFLSLPSTAQTDVRTVRGQEDLVDLRKVARAAYPYVQTIADAHSIAQFLESEELDILNCPNRLVDECALSQALRKTRTLTAYVLLKERCEACASGQPLEGSWPMSLSHAS